MTEVEQGQAVADHRMRVDLVSSRPKRVLIVVANPSTSSTLGWPVGFWAAELTRENEDLHRAIRHFYEAEKPTAVYCHGTAALADLTLSDGSYLVDGKTVTGFANAEEEFSDAFVGQQVMPWRVEDVLRQRGANYVQGGLFKAFAVRDGRLITGQQQYSGRKVAQMVIEAMGV
jgi:putative intracellular protease/amidase